MHGNKHGELITIKIAQLDLQKLLRAKFRNVSNFLVHEIGQGRGMPHRSLEMTEVLQWGGRGWKEPISPSNTSF